MVWNNKTGGITGYIGPRNRNQPGEIFLTIHHATEDRTGQEVTYDEQQQVILQVEESNRHLSRFNKRITNFKKETSQTKGGYLCCDGKGSTLLFACHPVAPRLLSIQKNNVVLSKAIKTTAAQWGETIDRLTNTCLVSLSFNNSGHATIPSISQLKHMGTSSKKVFFLPLENAPGGVVFQLHLSSGNKTTTMTTTKSAAETVSSKPSSSVLYATPTAILTAISAVLYKLQILANHSNVLYGLIVLVWVVIVYFISTMQKKKESKSGNCKQADQTHSITLVNWVVKNTDPQIVSLAENDDGQKTQHQDIVVPDRFLRAEKGNKENAKRRYLETLKWREDNEVDGILDRKHMNFHAIKQHYKHMYYKRGRKNEVVYYECPGQTNMKKLRAEGLTIDDLLHHYIIVNEFLWNVLEPDPNAKCITVVDAAGIGITDFAGEVVDYVKKASAFTGKHYPERAAYIFVINIPGWFNVVWNVVKGMIDPVTKEKINFVKGKKEILRKLEERIPIENIPEEYGGQSSGESPEEVAFRHHFEYNNGERETKPNFDFLKETK